MKNLEKYLSVLNGEVDALLLTSSISRFYGAEYNIDEGVAIVTKNGCRYFTDSRYIEAAENNIQGFEVLMVDREHSYCNRLNDAIADFGVTTLGYEENYLKVCDLQTYEKNLNAKLVPFQDKISVFRQIKEQWELDLMIQAQQITDVVFTEILKKIKAGITEKQLQAELIYLLYINGADRPSFAPIIVSGPNTSMPHGVAGDRVLQEGDFITMDFGARLGGYCADMTRTVALGYATEEMKKVYQIVLDAQLAGIAATKAGVKGKDVDAAARKVIEDAGYGAYFGHGYGHGLGLEVHESPNCNPSGETVMQVNMVSSAEPGIYIPGKFGVRIEDTVVFREDGCLNITKSPKELIIV